MEYASRRIQTGGSARTFNAFRLGLVIRFPFGLPAGGREGKG